MKPGIYLFQVTDLGNGTIFLFLLNHNAKNIKKLSLYIIFFKSR